MCGLLGWIGAPSPDLDAVERAARQLRHRGPDDDGHESGDGWGLAFRRLSILDLSPAGHQPMVSRDGRCVLAFNGEIYNYVELRRDLEAGGTVFRSGGDTEVLLELLRRDGIGALQKLNGMFALAFIDTRARTFLLARDRLGVKPLVYARWAGRLWFASELKALLELARIPRKIVPDAVVDYLAFGYLPGESGIFGSYAKLPPACVMHGSLDHHDQARPDRYWRLDINDDPTARALTPDEDEQLETLFTDAVRIRLRSDVPVGLLLSGGIDSGLVATAAAGAGGSHIIALTVGFDDRETDETSLAQASARRAGLRHVATVQAPISLDELDDLAWFFDEPFGDPSALPFFSLCREGARHATVFLSGDGGDEAFGGYQRYVGSLRHGRLLALGGRLGPLLRQAERTLPPLSLARYRLRKLALRDSGGAAAFDGIPNDPALSMVLPMQWRPLAERAGRQMWRQWRATRQRRHLAARLQRLDYDAYLPDDVLTKVDRASMAHSIEVRSPFLDVRLVEWAARLPRGTLLDRRQGKLPLRALAGKVLPGEVAAGRKRGFAVPLDRWFREPSGAALVQERLLSAEAGDRGLWDRAGVARLLAEHRSGSGRPFGVLLWRLLMLEAWARHYARPPAGADRHSAGRPSLARAA